MQFIASKKAGQQLEELVGSEITEVDRLSGMAHPFRNGMNPYETPKAEAPDQLTDRQSSWVSKERIKEFCSLSGSFSRTELLIATLLLLGLKFLFGLLSVLMPVELSAIVQVLTTLALYPVWGVALGKRSRDLGMTFTYGMVVGMILPFIIGLIFLFQGGEKSRTSR